jgi:hypothetical protein
MGCSICIASLNDPYKNVVVRAINFIHKRFLWSSVSDKNKINKVSWNWNVEVKEKRRGGLGVGSL